MAKKNANIRAKLPGFECQHVWTLGQLLTLLEDFVDTHEPRHFVAKDVDRLYRLSVLVTKKVRSRLK